MELRFLNSPSPVFLRWRRSYRNAWKRKSRGNGKSSRRWKLKEKWIAGAALDAFARQPLPEDSELWRLPNVIISPRIGGLTAQKWSLLLPIFVDNLKRFVTGEPLRNVVDKELGY